jgi:polyferredoxin
LYDFFYKTKAGREALPINFWKAVIQQKYLEVSAERQRISQRISEESTKEKERKKSILEKVKTAIKEWIIKKFIKNRLFLFFIGFSLIAYFPFVAIVVLPLLQHDEIVFLPYIISISVLYVIKKYTSRSLLQLIDM